MSIDAGGNGVYPSQFPIDCFSAFTRTKPSPQQVRIFCLGRLYRSLHGMVHGQPPAVSLCRSYEADYCLDHCP